VVNAASFASAPVSPGSIISIFGANLAGGTASASAFPLPTSIIGTQVSIGGFEAPLFFVSTGQINAQVPWELQGQAATPLTVAVNGQTSAALNVNLAPVGPGCFTANAEGTGPGAILDSSNRLVGPSNPATPGSVVQMYCTGLGEVTNQPPSGSPSSTNSLALTTATPTVIVGGAPATVPYSGLAPGWAGLYQVNVQIPESVTGGVATVSMSIGGVSLNIFTMAVQSSAGQGNLRVSITQLPAGSTASVSITSANGFSTVVTASQNVQVPSGTYTIVANSVPVGNSSYGAFPGQQTINVPADATTPVQVPYTVVLPQTTMTLDSQGMQTVSVSQDRSTVTLPASNQVAQSLAPGSVLAIGATSSTPSGLLRKVVSVSQSGSQIIATTTQATIADAFQQANFAFETSVNAQNAQFIKVLRPGVKLLPRLKSLTQATSAQVPSQAHTCTSGLSVPVEMLDMPILADENGSVTLSGEIDVCANFEFDWNATAFPFPKLNSLTATTTLGEEVHVNVTGTYKASFEKEVDVWSYTSPIPYYSVYSFCRACPFRNYADIYLFYRGQRRRQRRLFRGCYSDGVGHWRAFLQQRTMVEDL
jgi:uncharacterized protein (TIGR03437 family)